MQHPDEGTIHAWLDGALSAADASAIEAHVTTCATCAAVVREARGLIAASSRILSALDSVPGGVLPAVPPGVESGGERATVRRASVWRSPGWRAAAAIVVVGTVSWLATRPGGPSGVATERAATAAQVAAPPSAPEVEVHEAPSIAPRVADVDQKVAPRKRVGVVAAAPPAPAAMADAARKERDGGARAEVTGATIGAMANRAAASAGTAASAPAEQRLASPSPKAMMEGARPSMARAIAPASAIDAVGRLAGCYTLEAGWAASADRGRAARLLPARVELTREHDASADPAALVLRPAPREPAFAAGTRGQWRPIGGSTIELQVRDGATNRVGAVLSIVGDSISGQARAYSADSAAPLITAVKGQRVACPLQ